MINLNKKPLSQESLFEIISAEDVFNFYIPNLQIGTAICSPLRKDTNPSFSVFWSNRDNTCLYKDFAKAGEKGDCIRFVMRKYNLTYNQALQQIATDLNLQDHLVFENSRFVPNLHHKINSGARNKYVANSGSNAKKIQIRIRDWDVMDLKFWGSFGISLPTLRKYWVVPLSYYFVRDRCFRARKLTYAYVEKKDGKLSYKIYQPFARKYRFISNQTKDVHEGYNQLPISGPLLIITKSRKDVMSLFEVANIPAVSPIGETIVMKSSVIDEYKSRFDNIFTLFDPDDTGRELTFQYKNLFQIEGIPFPTYHYKNNRGKGPFKDFSDMVKNGGSLYAHLTLESSIQSLTLKNK